MNKAQIIIKAILKARGQSEDPAVNCFLSRWLRGFQQREDWAVEHCEELIFDHDFAKAFWAPTEKFCPCGCDVNYVGEDWKHHLCELVLAKDRLAYIAEFLP